MKTINKNKSVPVLLACFVLALILTGCSSEEDSTPPKVSKTTSSANRPKTTYDHEHDDTVTDLEKHQFEHKFADQCVDRELRNSVNKDYDKQRFSKSCMCIARYMMKDLTAAEAEKFLEENKSTRSLQIRFDNAAYNCLQKKTKSKDPTIFINRPKNVTR